MLATVKKVMWQHKCAGSAGQNRNMSDIWLEPRQFYNLHLPPYIRWWERVGDANLIP